MVSLADFAHGRVIVYFYPAALTAGCTVEAVDFSSAAPDFDKAGYAIVGISPDEPGKLARFIERNDLTIALLSDPTLETIKAYGAWGDRTLWGKTMTGLIRSTIVVDVDAEGVGTVVQAQYSVRATGHVNRLKVALGV
jgi:peroxiredoxin Q/BCP